MSYVYIETENWVEDDIRHRLFTVGHYKPDGKFESESDHPNDGDAAARCNYLNGGLPDYELQAITNAAIRYVQQ